MAKADFEQNDKSNPLRLAKSGEDYLQQSQDKSRDDIGVTGTLYPGEEATVTLTVRQAGWHHMDVEYAERLVQMLQEVIEHAKKHNLKLDS